ncbi:MAG: squalene/phytoene synthase family protein [Hyphomicrobiaceae bacterium]
MDPIVLEAARKAEPDRYVAALLAPADAQPHLIALAAFMGEVACIPARVREPMMGELRLQWWRDALANLASGETGEHPLLPLLGAAITTHRLATPDFLAIIDARSHDLTGEPHADMAALRRHLAAIEGTGFKLATRILGGTLGPPDTDAAGFAYGLARALGRLPERLHNGGFPIPADALLAAGIAPDALDRRPYDTTTCAGIEVAALALETEARSALMRARRAIATLPRRQRTAFLPLAMVEPYFSEQKRTEFLRPDQIADVSPFRRMWQMTRSWMSGRP